MKDKKRKNFGLTLVEVMIAMVIFAGALIPLFGNLTQTLKSTDKTSHYMMAQNLSKSIMNILVEKVRFKSLKQGFFSKDDFLDNFPAEAPPTVLTNWSGGWGPIMTDPIGKDDIPTQVEFSEPNPFGPIESIQIDDKSTGGYLTLGDYITFAPGKMGRIIKKRVFYEFLLKVEDYSDVKSFSYFRNAMYTAGKTRPNPPNENVHKASIDVEGEIKKITLYCYWLARDGIKRRFTLASFVVKTREDTDPTPFD